MPNHVHLLGSPARCDSLARALGRAHADYARHCNLKQRSCGHVWQARFFSCPLGPAHLWHAMAYIERNPVRAGLAEDPGQYRWSSAAAHLRETEAEALLDLRERQRHYDERRWAEVLRSSIEEEALGQRIREASRRGRPLGDDGFVRTLEALAGRRLRPLPVGRPRSGKPEPGQLSLMICV